MSTHNLAAVAISAIRIGERSRKEFRSIDSLAHSIRERGLLQPPVVREHGGALWLVCGQRRLEAVKSLGWSEIPVTVARTITDELAALYAEGDENTEREPFTVAEAVEHRRRIREAEARAAKERQRAAIRQRDEKGRAVSTSANLAEVEGPSRHERETRTRTAKATGFGHTTLDKAERVLSIAEDVTQPEPVRKVARQSAENLTRHGAKVDREFKAVEAAVMENSDQGQAYRDALWRKELLKELGKLSDLTSFDPARIVAVCDDDFLYSIDSTCRSVAQWHAEISRLRRPGLRRTDHARPGSGRDGCQPRPPTGLRLALRCRTGADLPAEGRHRPHHGRR